MSIPVNINGVIIPYPQTGDTGWGDDATKFATEVASVLGKIGQSQAPVNDDIIVSPGNLIVDGVIYADDNTTANTPVISFTGDANTGIGRSAADRLDFITNGISRFRIMPTGQLLTDVLGTNTLYPGYLCRAWVNFTGLQSNSLNGTYSQSGTTVTVTAANHGYIVGSLISIIITTGTALNGVYLVTNVIDSNNFEYTAVTSLTTSGNCVLYRSLIKASGNVSSVSYNGVGDYTVNFIAAMPDVYYAILSSNEQTSGNFAVNINRNNSRTDTAFRTNICTTQGTTNVDISWVSVGIFR